MHSSRPPGHRAARVLARLAAICAVAAVLTACGTRAVPVTGVGSGGTADGAGSSGRPGGTAGGSRSAHPGAGPDSSQGQATAAACLPAAIRVTLDIRSAGVAAGTSYVPLDFTNISTTSCELTGFPIVMLAGSSDQQIGRAAVADRSLAASGVVLAAGQAAHIWLRLADVTNLPTGQCQPTTAAGLRVSLPGQTSSTFISHPLTTCAKHVQGAEILTVEPFRPGQARPGTAQ